MYLFKILQGTPIVPAVFLGIIHQEEVNKSLAKCRELTKKLRKLIEANNEDHNLLSALGIEFSLPDEDCSFNTGRSSVTSAEGTAIFMKREVCLLNLNLPDKTFGRFTCAYLNLKYFCFW